MILVNSHFSFRQKRTMTTVEQELWNIFTYYTLHGNPRDPGFIMVCSESMFLYDFLFVLF